MIAHVLARLGPQLKHLVVNANSHLDDFAKLGLKVGQDRTEGFVGPLAGLQAAMHLEEIYEWYLMCPCDSPFLPHELLQTMGIEIWPQSVHPRRQFPSRSHAIR